MTEVLGFLQDALGDRYTLLKEIGRGGMGIVFLAEEHHPHRQVAIKVLDPVLSTRMAAERFVREVEYCANVPHPQCVPIFAAGEAAGLLYYVMPYIAGESLRQRLDRERTLPLDEALRIAQEVAEVVGFAHAQGVVHRDIKPDNILLSAGHAVVADFGIAAAICAACADEEAPGGLPLGTPAYMSPEQALGTRAINAQTDVFSLGCVLYEMIVGEPPANWPAESPGARPRLTDVPAAHRRRLDEVPVAVEEVLARALAWVPEERFASAAELTAALGSIRYTAASPGRTSRAWRKIVAAFAKVYGR